MLKPSLDVFPRLSIRTKLLIAFVGLSVLPILLVSLYGVYINVRTIERIALEDLSHNVNTIRVRTGNLLTNVDGDIRVLLHSSLLARYIRHQRDGERLIRQIEDDFVAFARTKGMYYQIRLVDAEQNEVLRVECTNTLDSASQYRIVPRKDLRHGGERYYLLLTDSLQRDQIAFCPGELLYKDSSRIPVISFVAPVWDDARRAGMLVVNVFAGNLFQELESQRDALVGEKVVLVGGDGHYLYDSDERHDWNRLIAAREEDNLQRDYPSKITEQILSGNEGVIGEGSDEIIAYAPLLSARIPSHHMQPSPALATSLFVFESVPRSVLTKDARASAGTFVAFLIVFLAGAIGLGLLATRQFTDPISELRRGAEVISRGSYRHRLSVSTGDEIEELARQFNSMAASLEEHDKEIQRHRNRLEEMVDHRTRQLVEEKGKLQAVLDNVPSAFVMLDREGRIQMASAAFAAITGLNPADVQGEVGERVFRTSGLCQSRGVLEQVRMGRVETHVDRAVDRNGVEQVLEHMTIPIEEHSQITSIVQIITDITKRKNLEAHLIHSEKLMATGEMAAIIAHGFRNSLTSIKMILQLQHESKHIGGATRKSLRVALDSIYRMETIVQELLNFARPSPMEFRPRDVSSLVNESLMLVLPQLKQQGIIVTKKLEADIPAIALDAAQIKEAVVNVLLNAIQAIESRGTGLRKGRLAVTTRRVVLTKTLREFYSPAYNVGGEIDPGDGGREIVLKKGTACAMIVIGDNGQGIDRATLRRMFDPFFTTKANGTGLGLPMVRRTVSAHGGAVVARSTKGKGTTFEIVLPLGNHATRQGADPRAVSGGQT